MAEGLGWGVAEAAELGELEDSADAPEAEERALASEAKSFP